MKKLSTLFIAAIITLLPSVVFAQGGTVSTGAQNLGNIFTSILNVINQVIPVLVTLITLFLIFRAVQFAFTSDETTKTTAQKGMIQAGIALIVVLSFWGIIAILRNSFGVQSGTVTVQTQSILPQF
jgi:uncharacterized membrane protein (GlpM family)